MPNVHSSACDTGTSRGFTSKNIKKRRSKQGTRYAFDFSASMICTKEACSGCTDGWIVDGWVASPGFSVDAATTHDPPHASPNISLQNISLQRTCLFASRPSMFLIVHDIKSDQIGRTSPYSLNGFGFLASPTRQALTSLHLSDFLFPILPYGVFRSSLLIISVKYSPHSIQHATHGHKRHIQGYLCARQRGAGGGRTSDGTLYFVVPLTMELNIRQHDDLLLSPA